VLFCRTHGDSCGNDYAAAASPQHRSSSPFVTGQGLHPMPSVMVSPQIEHSSTGSALAYRPKRWNGEFLAPPLPACNTREHLEIGNLQTIYTRNSRVIMPANQPDASDQIIRKLSLYPAELRDRTALCLIRSDADFQQHVIVREVASVQHHAQPERHLLVNVGRIPVNPRSKLTCREVRNAGFLAPPRNGPARHTEHARDLFLKNAICF
jgi:hypothetical protein